MSDFAAWAIVICGAIVIGLLLRGRGMTTRDSGKAGEHVATATLIEAERTDCVEWEDHRGRVVMLAEDYDALVAACLAVLDEQTAALAELAALVRGECPALLDDSRDGCGRLDLAIDGALDNARALRERLR